MYALKYPIGIANIPEDISTENIQDWIQIIEELPKKLKDLTSTLSENQLNTQYRPDGWTIRQVLHHIGDSHTNSYIRFKWALTEDKPIIKAYFEERWAELDDTKNAPITLALDHITALHAKMVYLFKNLSPDQLNKTFIHPETGDKISLKKNIGIYAWHSEHHYEHINQLLIRNNWK
ncbi:YfiT family bacillithiol transferase [Urechidicola vernalis]|uniref:Metal-dependent hydrolase n=1 Tax=Urechidicola vernalis TaxID=3075600 RepID=A0ABU2Y0W5_9FLAO|nr:putative metal-dependent hydrolase [Urechidicola sp. P050]MDT0551780.1 putative metal-dependent hydrolase [Urechidicola sp. P050]